MNNDNPNQIGIGEIILAILAALAALAALGVGK